MWQFKNLLSICRDKTLNPYPKALQHGIKYVHTRVALFNSYHITLYLSGPPTDAH